MSSIENKVILITGASSGIGEATAKVLASAGGTVMLGARRIERLEALAADIVQAGGKAHLRRLDVTSREDTQAFVDEALEVFGRVDVIVNNAGVMPLSPMASLKVDEWDRMVDVNIKGRSAGCPTRLRAHGGEHHMTKPRFPEEDEALGVFPTLANA